MKMKKLKPSPPIPDEEAPEARRVAQEEAAATRATSGRASTILSGRNRRSSGVGGSSYSKRTTG